MNATAARLHATETDHAATWERVKGRLRGMHGEAIFKSWLSPLELSGVRGGVAMVSVPTRFLKDWICSHYASDIRHCWQKEDATIRDVDIFVKPAAHKVVMDTTVRAAGVTVAAPSTIPSPVVVAASGGIAAPTSKVVSITQPMQDTVDTGLDPRFTFDNFVVGKPNELAHAAARRVAESAGVVSGCNPLFLYGGVGLGKTHLMHAIAWHIRTHQPERKVIYLSAEKFMYEFIRALKDKNIMSFKERFRSVDVLMVDDVQFISGKDSTQEEFFHTFNALVDQNRQVVLSGDRSPSDLDGVEERVRSRLGWGLVADIHATTFELRMGILQAKAESQSIPVPDSVLEFLAHKITSNVRELEGALNRVLAHASLVGGAITLDSTQTVLRDLLRANDRRLTVEDIQRQVAKHFNIKLSDMHSARRSRAVARPRQVAMYLAKRLTPYSLPEIGRKFGGKDHTTIMHAVKRVEALCEEDPTLAEDVELLARILQS